MSSNLVSFSDVVSELPTLERSDSMDPKLLQFASRVTSPPVELEPADERITKRPRLTKPGIYVRSRPPARLSAPKEELSDEAMEHLKSLGYVDD